MKVRVTMDVAGRAIDEVLTGPNAESIVAAAKAQVTKALGWKGMFLNAFSTLRFAQMAVEKYNEAHRTSYAIPDNCDDFLKLGEGLGYIKILEP
jgi:hypothetical protein